ncbi:MAG: EAL domain-containing protein [Gammaproteobacteria bacterium]|nr:EAL domain-containing protein [Gammaproteobacteria bacterium]
MALTTGQSLANNVQLLKGSASKYAIYGVVIAFIAIAIATSGAAYFQAGAVTIASLIEAQTSNGALWLLDFMPFFFAFWGQYVSSVMAYEASAMVIDQTSELRAQTTALEQQAMHDVTHDALTDLPNRVLFRDRLEQALHAAQHDRAHLAILMMDLDGFKEINDTLGHFNGDRLLKQVAARLQGIMQETSTVARLGGDEFAILLPKILLVKDAAEVARKIGKALQSPFGLEGLKLDVQASIGIAVYPEHGSDADTLLQRADVAMYMAKQDKTGYIVYDPKHDKHSPHRLTLMGELRHAIESDELVLHYQPKATIKTGEIIEVEALVRWQHPQHDLMRPDEFIPLAERTGLIKPLTVWVLNHALQQHSIWKEQGLDIGVAVNMSAHGLLDLELPDLIAGVLASHNAEPNRLVLEITETTIMVDQERALQILTRLADMGVRLAIDDFGTGYSSLAYLSKLPVREIKIDKSFVMDMNENEKHAMIVRATIDLAHNLGLEVIAEGTCAKEIFARLESLNCDAAQGEYISPPISVEEFEHWRDESEWRPRMTTAENASSAQLTDAASMSGTRPDGYSLVQDPDSKAETLAVDTKIRGLETYIGQLNSKLKRSGG